MESLVFLLKTKASVAWNPQVDVILQAGVSVIRLLTHKLLLWTKQFVSRFRKRLCHLSSFPIPELCRSSKGVIVMNMGGEEAQVSVGHPKKQEAKHGVSPGVRRSWETSCLLGSSHLGYTILHLKTHMFVKSQHSGEKGWGMITEGSLFNVLAILQ